jgi:hypothetical protein
VHADRSASDVTVGGVGGGGPVAPETVWLALDAFDRFGKGRHPASLNFGGCFAYARHLGNS